MILPKLLSFDLSSILLKIYDFKTVVVKLNKLIKKMGGFFSSMWTKVFKSNRTFNILILGLANAGKTTLLYQMYSDIKTGL